MCYPLLCTQEVAAFQRDLVLNTCSENNDYLFIFILFFVTRLFVAVLARLSLWEGKGLSMTVVHDNAAWSPVGVPVIENNSNNQYQILFGLAYFQPALQKLALQKLTLHHLALQFFRLFKFCTFFILIWFCLAYFLTFIFFYIFFFNIDFFSSLSFPLVFQHFLLFFHF